ncbi:hypothetical protein DDD63_04755 [Actinobaculum sp. 313]|nr:hypothetical protein DDD63_04755 [Actinobaculum sp. 313]
MPRPCTHTGCGRPSRKNSEAASNRRRRTIVWAFSAVHLGYAARADATERHLLASLASDVALLLGYSVADVLAQRDEVSDGDSQDSLADYELELAELNERAEDVARGEETRMRPLPMDEALLRLLPDMSENPELASELRNMTQDSVRAAKAENLATFCAALEATNDQIWVPDDDVGAWLAALNDLRLTLAARLEILDDDAAERVYRDAFELTGTDAREAQRSVETTDDMLAVVYATLTWWQESLLQAVRIKGMRG